MQAAIVMLQVMVTQLSTHSICGNLDIECFF